MDTNPPAVVLASDGADGPGLALRLGVECDLDLDPDCDPDLDLDRDRDLDLDLDLDRDLDVDLDRDLDRDPWQLSPLPRDAGESAGEQGRWDERALDLDGRDPGAADTAAPSPPASPSPRRAIFLALLVLALACAGRSAAHPRAHEQVVRGYDWIAKEDLERAGVAFEHALEFAPDLPEAMNGLGVVARMREDLRGARARFERAVHVDPDFAEGHANLGETLLAMGRDELAVAALSRALSIDPDLADARQNLARALLRRGLAPGADRDREWARARREYLHLLESDASRAAAHHDLAFMDFSLGRYGDAERGYRRAVELEPRSRDALHGLCVSLVRLGRCEEAVRSCEACLEVAPGADACRTSLRGARACAGP
ncbi:MAG TPA: tetratricopeptide repeat protein [Anaeromyxobacter sp.]